jgi:uncharacterized membrane-anchored protein
MMRCISLLLLLTFGTAACAATAQDQGGDVKPPADEIKWQKGPVTARLGDQAEVDLPKGFAFADAENTRKVLERTQNIPNGRELGTIVPSSGGWFAVFEFDPVGYVKDDEKASLDSKAILESITKGTEESNEERKKRGWDAVHITGWIDPPHYDEISHQLTWSLMGQASDGQFANYRTRLLGRRGVMSVELVVEPAKLNAVLPEFRAAATGGYRFTPENRYSSFTKGDKVAEYGLSALIVGGVAAAAVKMGFFKYLLKIILVGWKFVLIGFGALTGAIRKLFSRRAKEPVTAPAPDNAPDTAGD